ncbi:DUF6942 family protein [Saccharospirillum impatiens]|uniref:DUF6942 family protein n=1 Tax=Saccharospirillum impatiens TaxID=169438 RepID=UPI0006847EED|nr:hypothetical protein [Saccharospirillum impatiens]
MSNLPGLGDRSPLLVVYAPHRPPRCEPDQPEPYSPVTDGELQQLVQAGGNHWRKILNLYAKLLHGLTPLESDWQTCRDQRLLRSGSACALLFEQSHTPEPGQLCLVMGQTFGRTEGWLTSGQTLPAEQPFIQHPKQAVIVTPYFDYRQLSNARLASLVELISDQHSHWLAAFSAQTHQSSAP